jgi:hypothetical protein
VPLTVAPCVVDPTGAQLFRIFMLSSLKLSFIVVIELPPIRSLLFVILTLGTELEKGEKVRCTGNHKKR